MFEWLGPFLAIISPIIFVLCGFSSMFFKIPKNELDFLEEENIQRKLKKIFANTNIENFIDPTWQKEIKEYYHSDIKELQIANDRLEQLSIHIKNINMIFFVLGAVWAVTGSLYSLIYNIKIIEDSTKNITSLLDYSLIYLSSFLIIHLIFCFRSYKKNKTEYIDIIRAQKARLGDVFWGVK